jgi:hypothetical protein
VACMDLSGGSAEFGAAAPAAPGPAGGSGPADGPAPAGAGQPGPARGEEIAL